MAEVYFADGKWALVEQHDSTDSTAFVYGWSCVAHKCGWFGVEKMTTAWNLTKQTHPLCTGCKDEIPPELIGLWKMHNWDNIQELENKSNMFKQHHGFYLHGTSSGGAR